MSTPSPALRRLVFSTRSAPTPSTAIQTQRTKWNPKAPPRTVSQQQPEPIPTAARPQSEAELPLTRRKRENYITTLATTSLKTPAARVQRQPKVEPRFPPRPGKDASTLSTARAPEPIGPPRRPSSSYRSAAAPSTATRPQSEPRSKLRFPPGKKDGDDTQTRTATSPTPARPQPKPPRASKTREKYDTATLSTLSTPSTPSTPRARKQQGPSRAKLQSVVKFFQTFYPNFHHARDAPFPAEFLRLHDRQAWPLPSVVVYHPERDAVWRRYHLAVYEAFADTFGRSNENGIAWKRLAERVGVDPEDELVKEKVMEKDFSITGLVAGMQRRERVITEICATDRELESVPLEQRDRFYPEVSELREQDGMVKCLVRETKGRGKGPLGWKTL